MLDWIYTICKIILLLFEFFKTNIILLSQFVFFHPVFYFSLILSTIFTFFYLVAVKFVLRISLKTFLKFTIIYLKTRVVFFTFTHFRVLRVIFAVVDSNAAEVAAAADASQHEKILYCTSIAIFGVGLLVISAAVFYFVPDGGYTGAGIAALAVAIIASADDITGLNNNTPQDPRVAREWEIITADDVFDTDDEGFNYGHKKGSFSADKKNA